MGMELIERSFPSVLQSILGNLDAPDLYNCRLVNRAWNREACRFLKGYEVLAFDRLEQIGKYCDIFEGADEHLTLAIDRLFFVNLLFSHVVERGEEGGLQQFREGLQRLAKVVGSSITELHIRFDRVDNPSRGRGLYRELHEMIYEKFPNVRELSVYLGSVLFLGEEPSQEELPSRDLPNLVTLSVDLFAGEEELPECEEEAKMFVWNSLRSAVSLRTLHSVTQCGGNPVLVEDIIDNFSIVADSLESLYLGPPMTDEGAESLVLRGFPNLTQLDVYVNPSLVEAQSLEQVLRKYSHTLKQFRLVFQPMEQVSWMEHAPPHLLELVCMWVEKVPPPGVVLEVLEELSISHYEGKAVGWRDMPKLRKLSLRRCNNVSQILAPFPTTKGDSASCSLTDCEIAGYGARREGFGSPREEMVFPVEDPTWLTRLAKLHLQDLTLPRKTFATIVRNCQQLTRLTLRGCNGVDDGALTGIPVSKLQSISPVGNLKAGEANEEKAVDNLIRIAKTAPKTNSWIGNLTNLRALTLMENSEISDNAFLFGIVQCDRLRSLKCSRCMNLTWRAKQIIKHGLSDLVRIEMRI